MLNLTMVKKNGKSMEGLVQLGCCNIKQMSIRVWVFTFLKYSL